jgi:hypothetical protein
MIRDRIRLGQSDIQDQRNARSGSGDFHVLPSNIVTAGNGVNPVMLDRENGGFIPAHP